MQYLTSRQMAKVDSLAIEKYNVIIHQMMENAGSNIARFVSKLKPKHVTVLYGKGNNGADGLAAARHLSIYGIKVSIVPAEKDGNFYVKHQLKTLNKININPTNKINGDLILDGLLGYNIKGNPRANYAILINKANNSKAKIVSIDIPSGMNPDNGKKNKPCINADYTLTLALPKTGLKKLKNLYLINLGIPNQLYKELGIKIKNYFTYEDIVRI